MKDNPEGIDLAKKPTPEGEAKAFQTGDRLEQAHKHKMEGKSAEQGWVGRLIGSSDSLLNFCLLLALAGFPIAPRKQREIKTPRGNTPSPPMP